MLVKIKKEIEETVEVEFPYYCDYGGSFMKILSENEAIRICNGNWGGEISIRVGESCLSGVISNALGGDVNSKKIDESEFNNALESALISINEYQY